MEDMLFDFSFAKFGISSTRLSKSISSISSLAANFKLMELMCSTILDWKLRIDLIPWPEYFQRSPNVPSTSMELLEQLRKKMDFAFCPKILSMRKSSFSYGFGWFLSLLSLACSCCIEL